MRIAWPRVLAQWMGWHDVLHRTPAYHQLTADQQEAVVLRLTEHARPWFRRLDWLVYVPLVFGFVYLLTALDPGYVAWPYAGRVLALVVGILGGLAYQVCLAGPLRAWWYREEAVAAIEAVLNRAPRREPPV